MSRNPAVALDPAVDQTPYEGGTMVIRKNGTDYSFAPLPSRQHPSANRERMRCVACNRVLPAGDEFIKAHLYVTHGEQ